MITRGAGAPTSLVGLPSGGVPRGNRLLGGNRAAAFTSPFPHTLKGMKSDGIHPFRVAVALDTLALDTFPSDSSQVSASQAVRQDTCPHERVGSMVLVGVGTVSVSVMGRDNVAVAGMVVDCVSVVVPLLTVRELEVEREKVVVPLSVAVPDRVRVGEELQVNPEMDTVALTVNDEVSEVVILYVAETVALTVNDEVSEAVILYVPVGVGVEVWEGVCGDWDVVCVSVVEACGEAVGLLVLEGVLWENDTVGVGGGVMVAVWDGVTEVGVAVGTMVDVLVMGRDGVIGGVAVW